MSFPFKQFIEEAKLQGKSDKYIEECASYINTLESGGFPVIFSTVHLAILMKIQSDYLNFLIGERKPQNWTTKGILWRSIPPWRNKQITSQADHFQFKIYKYKKFVIKKKRGGYREIMAPNRDLKYIQKWILVNILSKYKLRDSCKGFRSGISIYDNAKVHEFSDNILKIDLLKFYDTITEKRIYGVFHSLGYAKNLSFSLAKICTFSHEKKFWDSLNTHEQILFSEHLKLNPPVLPQGSPCSPMLANIVATNMDYRFEKLGLKLNFEYSRYADDLTFSIKKGGKLPPIKFVKKIIEEEGFFVNEDKISYMNKGAKQYVTGLTTTNGVNVSKKWRKELSKHIYHCKRAGVINHLNFRKEFKNEFKNYSVLDYHDWLYGHICFINSINKEHSEKLLFDFKKITWFLD